MQGERENHYLSHALEIMEEEKWRDDREKMAVAFRSRKNLYEHKLNKKEKVAKQLRDGLVSLRQDSTCCLRPGF